MISTRTFALLLTAYLCAVCAVLTVTASADAASRTCTASGRAVTLTDAHRAPDAHRTLRAGDTFVPASGDDADASYSDMHAYPVHGQATRAYRCTARNGVDQWDEYRTLRGRVVARFDGAMFTAYARVIVAVWEG